MKKIRYYATLAMLTSSLSLTSCKSTQVVEPKPNVTEKLVSISNEIVEDYYRVILEKIEREREERAAFDKAVSNSEFIDSDAFRSVSRVSINYNDLRKYYEVVCTNDTEEFVITLPEERLISYMLKKCNVEYLTLNNINDPTVLEELSSLTKLKELSIYNSNLEDLDVLRNYSSLTGLRLNNCQNLSDISFFESLPNITIVDINGTKVSDITPLSCCEKLNYARLRCNLITNPEVLSDLENLTTLMLEYNNITDIKQLESLVKKGVISQERAESFVETATNYKLIFTVEDEEQIGETLSLNYFASIDKYYAEVKSADGSIVAFMCTDEPYNLYELSERVQEKKLLTVSNYPETGYLHYLNGCDKYEKIVIDRCNFDNLSLSDFDNVVSLAIYNCPNLVTTFKDSMFYTNNELRYLSVTNSGINEIDRLSNFRNLEQVELQDNNIDNFDVLTKMRNLKSATITLDNPDYDYTNLQVLVDKGIEIKIYTTIEKEAEKEKTTNKKLTIK